MRHFTRAIVCWRFGVQWNNTLPMCIYTLQRVYVLYDIWVTGKALSSRQLCSGRSTTAHIVFDLRSLIWGLWRKLYDYSRHKLKARKCLTKHWHWHLRRSPTVWLQLEIETFWLHTFGVQGYVGARDRPIRYPASGFVLAPHWQISSISYRFWVIQLAPKACPPVHPPARSSNPVTMTNSALEAIGGGSHLCTFVMLCYIHLLELVLKLSQLL